MQTPPASRHIMQGDGRCVWVMCLPKGLGVNGRNQDELMYVHVSEIIY